MGSRAAAVREVEVRASASSTAHVKKRTDLMSANSPNRAACRPRSRSTPPSSERCLEPSDCTHGERGSCSLGPRESVAMAVGARARRG